MNFRLVLLLWLLNYSTAQDADCNFNSSVPVGAIRYIYSPNYPGYYPPGKKCRWIADCPAGYNLRLNCPVITMPESESCSMDRLLVSEIGDAQLTAVKTYCGTRSFNVTSTDQEIAIGLITSPSSSGGRFLCTVTTRAIPATSPACRCGERRQNRIVGGEETGVNEFTMMAGLVNLLERQITCGAVIISKNYVLTAAHCMFRKSMNNYAVIVGEHNVATSADSTATQLYSIYNVNIHPSYTDSNNDYDIAVALVSEIQFNDRVQPVCMPFKFATNDFAGTKVTVPGWGRTQSNGPTSNVLRKIDLDVLQQSACNTTEAAVTDRQMCTLTSGKDTCQGDAGGPLLWTDPLTGALYSIGIVSFGRSCGSDTPGINTRVTSFLPWILRVTATTANDYCMK